MQRLEVSGAVRPIYGSLGVKRLIYYAAVPTYSREQTNTQEVTDQTCNTAQHAHHITNSCL